MSDRPIVICGRLDRLGARLKNLLSAWQFAEAINADLVVNWEPRAAMEAENYSFWNFFDKAHVIENLERVRIDERPLKEVLHHYSFADGCNIADMQGLRLESFSEIDLPVILYSVTYPYLLTPEDKDVELISFQNLFSRLTLNQGVYDCRIALVERCDLSSVVAVHIRLGDIVHSLEGLNQINQDQRNVAAIKPTDSVKIIKNFIERYAPESAYFSTIEQLDPNDNLVIFSDDKPTRQRFLAKYGDRAIDVFPEIEQFPLSPPQQDFVEFLALHDARAAIGGRSAFVRFAAELGGLEFKNVFEEVTFDNLHRELNLILPLTMSNKEMRTRLISGYISKFKKESLPDEVRRVKKVLESM